ncbi:hypothetical protein tb265_12460 [Gemmatimonadetes bacterium T265]|nr:hypothetical protein tb265_12460 [Gemmatimonadetes bacterium T265]
MIVRHSLSLRQAFATVGRPLVVYTAIAAAVSAAHVAGWHQVDVPALPVSLIAATLGILLGFRNNSGYNRWWEARTLWGGVVNQSRTFARQVLTFLPATPPPVGGEDGERRAGSAALVSSPLLETALAGAAPAAAAPAGAERWSVDGFDGAVRDRDGAARGVGASAGATREAGGPPPAASAAVTAEVRELVYAQIGFVNALRCHLRREDPVPEIAPFFAAAVVDAMRGEQNVPAAVLAWTATRLRRVLDGRRADDAFRLVALDRTLTELTNLLGGCERIKNTPIPRPYDWLPNVMVRLYLLILPLGMVADLGLLTPVVTAVIALLFLGLDAVGRAVETPFEGQANDTPMTALCRTIEINLRQMLGEREMPAPVQPVDGVLY